MKNNTMGKAGILLSMMIFGSIGLFVRYIDAPSNQIALARAVLGSAFLFLLIILRSLRRKPGTQGIFCLANYGSKKILRLIVSGIAIGFNWILLFQAYRYTSIAVATVSYYFAPVFIIMLSPLVLKEKLSRKRLSSAVIALFGLALMIVGELTVSSSILDKALSLDGLVGIGYGLAAALLYASVILTTKSVGDFPGLEMTQVQLVSGMIVLLPYVALTTGFDQLFSLNTQGSVLLLILGIVHTGFAYFLYFSSAKKVEAQSIAVLSYVDPVFAIIFAVIFLHEIPEPLQILGGLMILGAAYFGEAGAKRGIPMKLRHFLILMVLIVLLALTATGCLIEPGSGSDEFYAELSTVSSASIDTINTAEATTAELNYIDDSIATATIGEAMIGQTVSIRGTISEVKRFDSGHASARLTDKSGIITLYLHRSSDVDLLMLITGHEYMVSGIVDSYKGELQVLPQQASDVELTTDITFEQAEVIKVVDGDTIHAKTAEGVVETIRVIGVDTPELAKDGNPAEFFAEQAQEYAENLLLNKMIYLEQDHDDLDQYGRKLRYVWINQPQIIDERSIREGLFSALLISDGYASFVHYNDDRKYKELLTDIESEAQNAGLGVWG